MHHLSRRLPSDKPLESATLSTSEDYQIRQTLAGNCRNSGRRFADYYLASPSFAVSARTDCVTNGRVSKLNAKIFYL
jgi:hypothetical protein